MPNDAYQRRLADWWKKERERKAAMEPPPPYDPTELQSRVPLGCTMIIITAFMFAGYLIYRYFKIHGL